MRENNHDAIAIGHSRADPGIPEQLSTPSAGWRAPPVRDSMGAHRHASRKILPIFQSKTPFQAFLKLEKGS